MTGGDDRNDDAGLVYFMGGPWDGEHGRYFGLAMWRGLVSWA
jgi:hypothetical protein